MSSTTNNGFIPLTAVDSRSDSMSAVSDKTSRSSSLSTFEMELEAAKLAAVQEEAKTRALKQTDWTAARDGGVWLKLSRARDN
nr:hypothetical protein CFP56_04633 [Quercus suber]